MPPRRSARLRDRPRRSARLRDRAARDLAKARQAAAVVTKKRKASTRKPRKPPTIPAEHVNFYTPENGKFYSQFTYQDLKPESNSIRLLRIKPPTSWDVVKTEPIECDLLDDIPLDSVKGNYTTLSYCAGSPANIEQVVINGFCFNAFANLGHALRQARHFWKDKFDKRELLLWADQICINQHNPLERSHQVKLMRDIYSACEQVLVSLSTEQCSGGGLRWMQVQLEDLKPQTRLKHKSAIFSKGGAAAFCRTVVGSSWWARAWIRQEFICSPDAYFMAAFESLHWLCFVPLPLMSFRATDQVFEDPSLFITEDEEWEFLVAEKVVLDLIEAKLHVRQMPTSFPDLVSTLQLAYSWKASDPRDLIYASLGISDHSYNLCPNYSTDMSFQQICVDLACNVVRHDRNLDILDDACLTQKNHQDPDLPSWVPDWRNKAHSEKRWRMTRPHCATRCFSFYPDQKGRPNRILEVRGILHCTVGPVEGDWCVDLTTGKYITRFRQVLEGDEVWALDGANKVFVLRRTKDIYKLVGGVYIHERGGIGSPILSVDEMEAIFKKKEANIQTIRIH